MRDIDRPDLEEMCFKYATKDKQVLCYHENQSCQGSFYYYFDGNGILTKI